MDRLLEKPRNRGLRKYRGMAAMALAVVGVVFAVASLVPLGLYVLAGPDLIDSISGTSTTARGPVAAPTTPVVVFSAASVVDVEAFAVRGPMDVLVRDGRIAAIGATGRPPEALVVNARGKYLMPGLIDTHVHVTDPGELLLYLAGGVTTVQSLGDQVRNNIGLGAEVQEGRIAGPRVVTCDYVVAGLDSAGDVDRIVSDAVASGAGCIKIYSPPDWTPSAHGALIRAARAAGLRIGGHLPRNLPLETGLAHGQQFVAHAEEFLYAHFFKFSDRFNESRIEESVDLVRQSGAAIAATLVAYHAIVDQVGPEIDDMLKRPELRFVRPDVRSTWMPGNNRYRQRFSPEDGKRLGAAYEFQRKLVAAWANAGIPLVLGTDASPRMPFVVPGFSALDEVDELRRAGLSNALVLRSATIDGATLLGQSQELGSVANGKLADLILLDGNPLDDLANLRRREGVMVNGRWMPERWLRKQLEERSSPER